MASNTTPTMVPTTEVAKEENSTLGWEKYREQSLLPGGFGRDRISIWLKLLHLDLLPSEPPPYTDSSENDSNINNNKKIISDTEIAHQDERQIRLDTDRSFVLYPVEKKVHRERLQLELYDLIVSVFRKRPRLNYFQGYHDIITVVFLTLPRELQLPCAERVSLYRLRDSMGPTLEPVLGLLRILGNLIRLADPSLSAILESTSPLPFYSLPNLLTLFSHDTPTLPLIQHIFDYLLCRPPIAVVYLAAAVIIVRKEQVEALQKEGEQGMIHSLLSSLPDLCEGVGEEDQGDDTSKEQYIGDDIVKSEDDDSAMVEAMEAKIEVVEGGGLEFQDQAPRPDGEASDIQKPFAVKPSSDDPIPPINITDDGVASGDLHDNVLSTTAHSDTLDGHPDGGEVPITEPDCTPREEGILNDEGNLAMPPNKNDSVDHDNEKHAFTASPSASDGDPEEPPHSPRKNRPPPIPLPLLLNHANQLYMDYPPSHPSLAVSAIMGPRSVVHAWTELPVSEEDGDEAESWVGGEGIVLPYVEEEDEEDEFSDGPSSISIKRQKEKARRVSKNRRRFMLIRVKKRTMIAGVVLMVAVAMAMYGVRIGGTLPERDGKWRRVKGWAFRACERILDGFGTGLSLGFGS